MVRKEIGCAGVAVGGVPDETGVSAARDDVFSVTDDVNDVGGGREVYGVILMPRSTQAVRMGVGRNVQKFGGDQATTGGEMRLPWFDRGRFVAN
jgi:hypothetical protein